MHFAIAAMAFHRVKVKSVAKIGLCLVLVWLAAAYLYPSWEDMESVERMKAVQRRHEEEQERLSGHGEDVDERRALKDSEKEGSISVNDLGAVEKKATKKKKTLHEKLKPKLIARQGKEGELWNDIGAARNAVDLALREEGYKMYAFNSLISQRLGFRRDVPDTRHEECKKRKREFLVDDLPTASVIICFFHEELMTLLRTVHSVVDRTPVELLHEVLLVDDANDVDIASNLTEHFERQSLTDKVRVLRAPERLGLIRARIFGARRATGDAIVFLDSHVEANAEWLEPLLERIRGDRTRVVTPIIDIISADTFAYESSPLVRGGFNWGLNFKWDAVTREELKERADFAKPVKSPTMAGGLFAMDRLYFNELGEYDAGKQSRCLRVCLFVRHVAPMLAAFAHERPFCRLGRLGRRKLGAVLSRVDVRRLARDHSLLSRRPRLQEAETLRRRLRRLHDQAGGDDDHERAQSSMR